MKQTIIILCILLLVSRQAKPQQFIGCLTDSGWAETAELRKTFTLKGDDFEYAGFQTLTFNVEVTSLGYHEVYINHTRPGDNVMQPAVSQLDKRALQVSYDITNLVHEGENEIELVIGQGWGRIYGTPAVVKAEVYCVNASMRKC